MSGEMQQQPTEPKAIPKWIPLVRGDKDKNGEVSGYSQQMVSACQGHFKDPEQAEQYLQRLRFAAISQVARDPNLQKSVQDPDKGGDGGRSLAIAMIKAAQLGVELESTVFKHGYLISRYNGKTKRQEITFQLGAYGKLYLLNEYHKILAYSAVPLYEYDFIHKTFTYKVVNNREIIEHDVGATQFLPENADGSDPRGKIVGMYVIMKIEGMGEFVKVGRLSDLYKAAYDSKKYKKGDQWIAEMSFWDKHGKAMMEKTLASSIAGRIPIGGIRNSPKTEAIDLPCVNIIGTQAADESGDESEFNDAYLIPEDYLTPQGDEDEIVLPD